MWLRQWMVQDSLYLSAVDDPAKGIPHLRSSVALFLINPLSFLYIHNNMEIMEILNHIEISTVPARDFSKWEEVMLYVYWQTAFWYLFQRHICFLVCAYTWMAIIMMGGKLVSDTVYLNRPVNPKEVRLTGAWFMGPWRIFNATGSNCQMCPEKNIVEL